MNAAVEVVLGLAALVAAAWAVIYLIAEKEAMVTKGPLPGSPRDAGLGYEDLIIQSGARRLQAWWIPAASSNDSGKAILIYHGNTETIPEWIPALKHLWHQGISTFIFDYSGFGRSTGRATFRTLREDALAARRLFDEKAGSRAKYLLGLSLGSGVLLQGYASLLQGASGVVLVAAFSSLTDVALAWKIVPAPLAHMAPRNYDNAAHIRLVRLPVLIVHSTDDQLFPLSMAEKLLAAANDPRNLVLVKGLKHNDMLEGRHAEYLAPVLEYLEVGKPRPQVGPRQRAEGRRIAGPATITTDRGRDRAS